MSSPQEVSPLAVGTRVDGYEIESVLTRGRFTFSYAAKTVVGGAKVAITEFLPHEFATREGAALRARDQEDRNALRWWMRSFLDRAAQLQAVSHPGLVRVLRNFEANGTGYYVTEPTIGETLASLLEREGTLNEAQLRRILASVLGGLERAHASGLLHRDLCPQNIWLRGDGSAAIADFGILRAPIRFKSRTLTTAATPPYSAPEEFAINGNVGAWSDIYALGSIAYRAVSGQDPVDARERERGVFLALASQVVRVRASDALLGGIDAALQLQPADRPQSIAQWNGLLGLNLAGEPAPKSAAPQRTPGGALPPVKSGSTASQIALLLIPLVVAAGIAAWYFLRSTAPTAAVEPPTAASVPAPPSAQPSVASPAVAIAPTAPVTQGAEAAATSSDLDKLVQELLARDKKAQAEIKEQQKLVEQLSKQNAKNAPGTTSAALIPPATKTPKGKPGPTSDSAAAPTPGADATAANAAETERRSADLEAEIKRLQAEHEETAKRSVEPGSAAALSSYRNSISATIHQNLHYPTDARTDGDEGDGVVRVRVRRDGGIQSVELIAKTGFAALDAEALAVFRRTARFSAMPSDVAPEENEVSFTIPISFKLDAQ